LLVALRAFKEKNLEMDRRSVSRELLHEMLKVVEISSRKSSLWSEDVVWICLYESASWI
jgi:hypothetical protein